ncbi:MAG: hypothetical protein UR61_C0008G0003 [candidate division WS6 bacterium GW2011_GWE1_34_7]|uniref:Uncharacterized protein n=1 Tax=candidate division WS6 bacterium GW2011_GWE1_34_7 TaxID=1619093 RepID=A0A0G0DSC2_9BACT|nr:MAG: hypothetical protein UR61_C0008G0003 [candidate division WS6 bacterium GW2011_GWE1_34_7]
MKKYLVISIVILSLIAIFLLLFFFRDKLPKSDTIRTNSEEVEALVDITQSEMSAFVFATQESSTDHRIHINLTPFLTLNIDNSKISELYIENFKGESGIGEVLLIHPTTLATNTIGRTFLFTESSEPIKNETITSVGESITYAVVETVSKFNEVSNTGNITPHFGIIIKDISTVNYQEILEKEKIFEGSKYLEYSKVDVEKLNTEIQFDLRIKFEDGKEYFKRFKGTLKGSKLETEIAPLILLEVVEK